MDFEPTFEKCAYITTIPEGLFEDMPSDLLEPMSNFEVDDDSDTQPKEEEEEDEEDENEIESSTYEETLEAELSVKDPSLLHIILHKIVRWAYSSVG